MLSSWLFFFFPVTLARVSRSSSSGCHVDLELTTCCGCFALKHTHTTKQNGCTMRKYDNSRRVLRNDTSVANDVINSLSRVVLVCERVSYF